MELSDADCYRALASRDRRFESRFVVAVLTTGVYCIPGCPAPLPRRRNVRFLPSAAAAEVAGFRPCLRCRPDARPGSPARAGTRSTVSRALALIDAEGLPGGVERLAERLGVGSRHLRRLFREQVGTTPAAVARTRRAHFARQLIEQTRLPMTRIALSAGFASLRTFNTALRQSFHTSPRELRGRARPAGNSSALALRLDWRGAPDWDGVLGWLGPRALPGVEQVTRDAYRRTARLGGQALLVELRRAGSRVELRLPAVASPVLMAAVDRASRLLDLKADVAEIASHLRRDPALRAVLAARPGLRVPGCWDGFELAVRAVLGQQVSVRGATTLAGRLVERCGEPLPQGAAEPGLTHLFPTPERLARAELGGLGLTGGRQRSLRALAEAVIEGRLRLEPGADPGAAREALLALPGIGPWTADYVALRALADPDAFPASDLGLRRALARRGRRPTPAELAERARRWSPWRGYAAMALWARDAS
jgi:AraC family transcriptional regulator of adaptative response / DNA-3-methyladenine glycosylase II